MSRIRLKNEAIIIPYGCQSALGPLDFSSFLIYRGTRAAGIPFLLLAMMDDVEKSGVRPGRRLPVNNEVVVRFFGDEHFA
jgi:hypothetical protein